MFEKQHTSTRLLIFGPCGLGVLANFILPPIIVAGKPDFDLGLLESLGLFLAIAPAGAITALLALPPYIIVSAAVNRVRHWTFPRRLCLASGGTIVLLVLHGLMQIAVWQSTSSTAVIGLMFLPIYGVIAVWPGLLIGWLVSLLPILPEGSQGR